MESSKGNRAALDKLVPLVYQDLRRLARHYMREERPERLIDSSGADGLTNLLIGNRPADMEVVPLRWHSAVHPVRTG
jgi:hypothetical protein